MRKFLKNNILEIFQTIFEAHSQIKKLIDKKDFESAQIVLGDCQNAAVQIGTAIEGSEGEGFVTIGFLEEYCEAVYELAVSMSDGDNGYKAQKRLDKVLIKAENSVKNDIKVKLEVVFLPYKASMWDSLESVWKAANDDPECDARVIPIPYFDRKPDGSFGEIHYEGGGFPEYVPLTHYKSYDLELMRPDVIYFHNPYDANNFVTSVDPRFYSSELKKYTDKLVYIPYFVLGEIDPENQEAVDKIFHFVNAPGVFNADKVVVQSEAMRQAYIKVLLSLFGDTPKNRKIVQEKILALGSPKFDKLFNLKSENEVIPEAWQEMISKPDGSRKKVIFYNTGISDLLEHNEKWVEKIKKVIELFKVHSDDVVLLWRPHPLIRTTLRSMRPSLLSEYDYIVKRFCSEKWGIYDDTSDLHRAIEISDAYYGDRSSVMELFQADEKPVMRANFDISLSDEQEDNRNNNCLSFYSFDVIENNIYFQALNFNGVYRSDINGTDTEYLGFVPGEMRSVNLYSSVIAKNGKLYFAPMNADDIAVYDTESSSFTKLALDHSSYGKKGVASKFFSAVLYKDFIYFIPCRYRAIVRLDTRDHSLEYFGDWCKEYFSDIPESDMLVKNACILKENWLYMAFVNDNRLVKYNLDTNEYAAFELPFYGSRAGFMDMCVCNGDIWLIQSYACAIVRFNEDSQKSAVLADRSDRCSLDYPFINILPFENKLLLVSFSSDRSVVFDMETSEFKTAPVPEELEGSSSGSSELSHYFGRKMSENTVLLANVKDHSFILWNVETNEYKTIRFTGGNGLEKYKSLCIEKSRNRFMTENRFFTLRTYLEYVNGHNRDQLSEISHVSSGEKIHKYISDPIKGNLG